MRSQAPSQQKRFQVAASLILASHLAFSHEIVPNSTMLPSSCPSSCLIPAYKLSCSIRCEVRALSESRPATVCFVGIRARAALLRALAARLLRLLRADSFQIAFAAARPKTIGARSPRHVERKPGIEELRPPAD